ncbi:hypothetical protein C0J52_19386 [Blattella germanica]|nr:hypothetical protein C0J52_19386 [Blattella germanica]
MGVESPTCWVIVRRYDELDSNMGKVSESQPLPITLQQDSSFASIKSQVKTWLGISEKHEVVMKLRRIDGTLMPFSSLLCGSTQAEPFILEIARVHQNTPASPRTPFSPSYIETVQSKLKYLEQRVEQVESSIPKLQSQRQASIEQTINQLGTKVHFLDKRLDELVPQEWKDRVQ